MSLHILSDERKGSILFVPGAKRPYRHGPRGRAYGTIDSAFDAIERDLAKAETVPKKQRASAGKKAS